MRIVATLAVLLAACSSASTGATNGDAGGDGANDDTGAPVDATHPTLEILPNKSVVLVDTAPSVPVPATLSFTALLHGASGDTDVTAEVALSVTNPTLGSFDRNLFTSSIAPKDAVWGATDAIEGKARGVFGEATLTVAWFKATGDQRVVFFQLPTGEAPAPARDVLAQIVPSGAPIDVSYLLVNDPRNPPDPGGAPIDAQPLIASVRAMKEGDATNGCPPIATNDADGDGIDDTFLAAPGGSKVCFEIVPAKTGAPSTSMFLDAYIDVVEKPSDHILQLRTVLFFVPP